jgi:hypothetical protein
MFTINGLVFDILYVEQHPAWVSCLLNKQILVNTQNDLYKRWVKNKICL